MLRTLTLISSPSQPCLDDNLLTSAAEIIEAKPDWSVLAPQEAAQLSADISDDHLAKLRAHFMSAPIDIVCTPAERRRMRLLVADMESTIIEQECLDELADEIGIGAEVADITTRAMRGELDFEPALRARVKLLAGLPHKTLEKIYDERVTLMPGAEILLATLKHHGCYCALVSGGFDYFADKIATRLGFDFYQCNQLAYDADRLSGEVIEPILGREAKAEILGKLSADLNIPLTETMAVGDGSNDLAMLAQAGYGFAFRAKPLVAEAAQIRIDHGDLTALLYTQGFAKGEFVSPRSGAPI